MTQAVVIIPFKIKLKHVEACKNDFNKQQKDIKVFMLSIRSTERLMRMFTFYYCMMNIKLLSIENIDEGLIMNERTRDPWPFLGYNLHNPLETGSLKWKDTPQPGDRL